MHFPRLHWDKDISFVLNLDYLFVLCTADRSYKYKMVLLVGEGCVRKDKSNMNDKKLILYWVEQGLA